MNRSWMVILCGVLLLASAVLSSPAGVIVVLKNGRVERRDENGAYKGVVGNPNAVAAATDGAIIAIVYENGQVCRYDANGSYKGTVGGGKATGVQVTAGQIIVTYADGQTRRYDAQTGAYKGML